MIVVKNTISILFGFLFLGSCIIVSSLIFSNNISKLENQNHIVHGSLGISQSINSSDVKETEFMPLGEIASFFYYNDIEEFTKDLFDGKLGEIPYVNINGKLFFSRTVLNDWLIDQIK